jgi:uncharacterized membrane-anchored protein
MYLRLFVLGIFLLSLDLVSAGDDKKAKEKWAIEFMSKIKPQRGVVVLPNGVATLKLSDKFYYIDPSQAKLVLEEAWGNPPDNLTQGMIFPANKTPLDGDVWGMMVEYVEEGYVEDKDAKSINYEDMLVEMKEQTEEASKLRVKQNFESIRLVGWAQAPHYDEKTHKLHWAKEIEFGGDINHTLNYDIRVLGKKGYLELSFIAGMEQINEINATIPEVLISTEFNNGFRYEEFNAATDKIATYGIGGLITGGLLAKAGFFAKFLLIFKKLIIFIVIGIGWLFKKIFSKKEG